MKSKLIIENKIFLEETNVGKGEFLIKEAEQRCRGMKHETKWIMEQIYLSTKRSNIRSWQVQSQDLKPGLPGSKVLTSDNHPCSRDLGPPGSGAGSFPVWVCEMVELNRMTPKAPPRLISRESKFCFTRVCLVATWRPVGRMSLPRVRGCKGF